jgi:hypothetical protein
MNDSELTAARLDANAKWEARCGARNRRDAMQVLHGPFSDEYRRACNSYDDAVREYQWAARIVGLCIDKAQFARAPTDWTEQENLMLRVKETSRRVAILTALRGAVPPDTKAEFGRYESSSGGGWHIKLTFPPGADDLAGYRAARKAVDQVLLVGENAAINVIVPAPGKVAPVADPIADELASIRDEVKAADELTCPDCGRVKARNAEDAGQLNAEGTRGVFCPKWWAVRDPSADADCLLVRSADRAAPKVAPPPAMCGFALGDGATCTMPKGHAEDYCVGTECPVCLRPRAAGLAPTKLDVCGRSVKNCERFTLEPIARKWRTRAIAAESAHSNKPPMRTVDMFLNEIADCAVRLEQAHASVRNNVALYVDIGGAQFQFDGARMRSAGFAVVGVPNTPGSLLREKPAGVPAPPVRRTCLYGRCVTPPDFMVPDGKGGYTYVCTEHLKEAPNWPVAVLVSDGRPLWKGAATMEPVKCSHEACATMMEDRGAAAQLCPPCARWAKAEHGTNTCDGCAKVGHYETPEKQDDLEPVDADDEPDAEVVQCGPAAVALAERIVADHRRVEADEVKDAPAPVARLSPGELAAAQGFPRPPPETSQEFFGRMFPMPLRNAETFMLAVREAVPAATDVYMTTRSMTHEIRVTVPASATDVDLDGWRRRARFAIDHARPLGVNVEVSIERELPFAVLDAGHDRFLVVDAGREIAAVTGDEARVAVVRLLSGGAR